ncbi:helix-turn-helix domain-containing protein [Microvirga aerilata]|uniref:helix-turn-helix domain-containing protein n=1 Tax=Microvirga aerilata TaxID=670292 RepID=UPI003628C012
MPQPYSPDLRERVLVACARGELPQVEIARRFQVCPATVSNWRRQEREEGRRAPSRTAVACPRGWMRQFSRCCASSCSKTTTRCCASTASAWPSAPA